MFSKIDRCGKSAYDWNTVLTSRRYGGSAATSRPASSIAPAVGSSKPPIIRSVVVLPQPDGPSSATNRPRSISSDSSSTATTSSNRFVRPMRRMSNVPARLLRRRLDRSA